jgi:hypothetical protein
LGLEISHKSLKKFQEDTLKFYKKCSQQVIPLRIWVDIHKTF